MAASLALSASAAVSPPVFVVGDSISIHYGPFLETFLRHFATYDRKQDTPGGAKAEQNLDIPAGANGGDSRMVLAYLRARRLSDPIRADVLVLNCGLHDLRRDPVTSALQVPLDAYGRNLKAILDEARAANLSPVWIRTSPVIDAIHNEREPAKGFVRHAADVADYNRVADQIMAAAGIPVVDLHAFLTHFIPAGFADHVHYTPEISEKAAAFLAGALASLLPSLRRPLSSAT